MTSTCVFWFRRDLRLHDNHGLYQALTSGLKVLPIFIFDKHILDKLDNKSDSRVTFIYQQVLEIKKKLNEIGSDLEIYYDFPEKVHENLIKKVPLQKLMFNHDYEPYAIERDTKIKQIWTSAGKTVESFKDQVLFEKGEVVKDDLQPYTVYTPYSKKWKARMQVEGIPHFPSEKHMDQWIKQEPSRVPTLSEMGFEPSKIQIPPIEIPQSRIKNYEQQRDIPSVIGTSRLSVHFRFGTISVREKLRSALALSEKWVNELIWREFYMQILFHFPHVVNASFKSAYDRIEWRNNEKEFELWKWGETGYPLVDAGMRELIATGFMHNRVRMVVASFLTKHLLIDWRWGEAWFARHLLDFELASNNGGWQWAAGSGVDAAPYFRVFNPELQTQKFDPKGVYIKQWVPEFGTLQYMQPMVSHAAARLRCLEVYKRALNQQ